MADIRFDACKVYEPPIKNGVIKIVDDDGKIIATGTFVLENDGYASGEFTGKIIDIKPSQ